MLNSSLIYLHDYICVLQILTVTRVQRAPVLVAVRVVGVTQVPAVAAVRRVPRKVAV